MKRATVVLSLALVMSAGLAAQRAAQIRLATILPANSKWDQALKQMGAEWQKVTEGRVRLNVFSGGQQGGEPAIIRGLQLGRQQAAAFSQPGLAAIDPAFNVFGLPFFFESDEELRYVLDELEPALSRVLLEKGLILFLNWGHGGWAYVFTQEQASSLDDIKTQKLFTTAGDDEMVQWYRQHGFEPVPLAIGDVLLGLNTGLITAYPSPPYLALLLQWYSKAPYMLDVPLGPVVGATVVTDRVWKGLSPEDQKSILAVCDEIEERLMTEVPAQERSSVDEMKKRGLTVTTLDPTATAEFHRAAQTLTASMRGRMVPAEIYDAALRARDAYRAQRGAAAR